MANFIQKFKNFFKKSEGIKKDLKIEEEKRLKELHKQAREPLLKKKKLTVEDFERAKLTTKQKNKTLSSNF